jgi:hypothetical protein
MTWINGVLSWFDRAISLIVGSSIDTVDLTELKNREGAADSNPARVLSSSLNSTDVRSTAILQHVSIMIAVCGLLYSQSENGSCFRFVFAIELLCYVLLTLFCLRLLLDRSGNDQQERPDLQKEALWKEKVQYRTGQLTFLVTVALAITVIFKVIR